MKHYLRIYSRFPVNNLCRQSDVVSGADNDANPTLSSFFFTACADKSFIA
ncbi:hypothetical protein [Spirosoma flavus]